MTAKGKQMFMGILLVVVLVAWWAVLLQRVESSVFALVPILDEQQYLSEAHIYSEIDGLEGSHSSSGPFFMSPLYPRLLELLGVTKVSTGDLVFEAGHFRIVYWFQVLLWLGTVVLLRLIAGRLFTGFQCHGSIETPKASRLLWLPSLLFAFYAPMAIYTMMILVEMSLVFLVTLLLFFLGAKSAKRFESGTMGLLLGLAILLRGSMIVLLPVVVFFLWRQKLNGREKAVHLGLFMVLVMMVLAPPVIHNSKITGHISPPSLNGGLNLYLGNGPEATGLGTSLRGDWLTDPAGTAELAQRLQRSSVTLVEADGLWRQLAMKSMAQDPVRTLLLTLKKMHLQIQAWEMDQVTSFKGWGEEVPLLGVLFVPWWALMIPALWGVASMVDKSRRSVLLMPAGVLLVLVLTQSLFFVVSRYRMVLLPVVCLLALAGVMNAQAIIQSRTKLQSRSWLMAFGVFAISIVMVIPWGWGQARSSWKPLAQANYAQRWAVLGAVKKDQAAFRKSATIYARSLVQEPGQSGPYLGYSTVLRELNRPEEADRILAEGIKNSTPNLDLRRELLTSYLASGRLDMALNEGQQLLLVYPNDSATLHNVSVLMAQRGQVDQAIEMARRLMITHPALAQGYIDLGILLARAGKTNQAREVFEKGLDLNPGHSVLTLNWQRLAVSP